MIVRECSNKTQRDALEPGVHQVFNEERVAWSRQILRSTENLVIGTLHDVLLELDRVLDIDVVVLVERDELQLGVELGYPVESQQTQ